MNEEEKRFFKQFSEWQKENDTGSKDSKSRYNYEYNYFTYNGASLNDLKINYSENRFECVAGAGMQDNFLYGAQELLKEINSFINTQEVRSSFSKEFLQKLEKMNCVEISGLNCGVFKFGMNVAQISKDTDIKNYLKKRDFENILQGAFNKNFKGVHANICISTYDDDEEENTSPFLKIEVKDHEFTAEEFNKFISKVGEFYNCFLSEIAKNEIVTEEWINFARKVKKLECKSVFETNNVKTTLESKVDLKLSEESKL